MAAEDRATLTRGDSSSSAGDGNGATTAAYNVAALLPGVGTEGAGPVAGSRPPKIRRIVRPTSSRIMYAVGTSTSVIRVMNSPEAERDRHQHRERGVEAPVPHQRRKAEEGGERRQQDRPEAVDVGLAHRERQAGRLEIPPIGRDSPGLLTGVVVNNSLIMVDFINRARGVHADRATHRRDSVADRIEGSGSRCREVESWTHYGTRNSR